MTLRVTQNRKINKYVMECHFITYLVSRNRHRHFSRTSALLWNIPCSFLHILCSSGLGLDSHCGHYLYLFLGSSGFKSALVNSQLVCLQPVGNLNNVMLNLNDLLQLFAWSY